MYFYPQTERAGEHPVPWEIQDTVELWARKWGRHGRVEWVPGLNCYAIHLTRRPDDPIMREWQEGRLAQSDPPTESVLLHEFDPKVGRYVPLKLEELGPSGIEELLDKGNAWSGRGEFKTLADGLAHAVDQNKRNKEEWAKHMSELGRDIGSLARRTVLNLPWVPGSDVPAEKSLTTPTTEE